MKIKLLIIATLVMLQPVFVPARARADENAPSFSRGSSLLEKYLAQPEDQIKLAKYVSLLPPLMRDRTQTLQLGSRGFEENNPLLGRRPSGAKINSYFLIYAVSLFAASRLPEPFASSILDSVRYQEEIVIGENERLFDGKASVDAAPIAFMFTIVY